MPLKILIRVRYFVGVAALLVIAFLVYKNYKWQSNASAELAHTQHVLLVCEKIISGVKDIETSLRGYLVTEDIQFLSIYAPAQVAVNDSLHTLYLLVSDDSLQLKRVDTLQRLTAKRIDITQNILKRENFNSIPVNDIYLGKQVMDSCRGVANRIEIHENQRLIAKQSGLKNSVEASKKSIILLAAFAFLFGIASSFVLHKQIKHEEAQKLFEKKMNQELSILNEELKAANEELHAANEEIFSTNEELAASNENLLTSNQQLNEAKLEIEALNVSS